MKQVRGFTIDAEHTRDIDDALWIEPQVDGGWHVTVSIADVAREVLRDTDVDKRAREMVATKYFASGNSPMLPRALSEDSLSLWQGQRRRVIAIQLQFDAQCAVTAVTIERASLVSQRKLAYHDVPAIIANPAHPLHAQVSAAGQMANIMLDRRRANGALALYDLNSGWITTEEGHLRQIEDHADTLGHVIVQEFMVAANVAVATHAVLHDVPLLFRNHVARAAAPDRTELMRQLDEASHIPVQNVDALRARTHLLLDRAEYGADVRGHYGLNVPVYTHFTSPIRRYADLVNHRQMRAFIKGSPLPYTRDELVEIAAHISEVLNADRDSKSQHMKLKAEASARRAVDQRRLDGLNAKDFERVTKLEARSGNPPSPAFLDAFVRRTSEDRTPLLCFAVVLTAAPESTEWAPIREAVVAALARRPEDAVSVLVHARQVHPGWPDVSLLFDNQDDPNPQWFVARAAVSLHDVRYAGTGKARQKKRAEQLASVDLVAALLHVSVPAPVELPSIPAAVPLLATVDSNRDPLSLLNEWCQRMGIPAPVYNCTLTGPAHQPTITCHGTVARYTATDTASTKQHAKRKVAQALLKQIQ